MAIRGSLYDLSSRSTHEQLGRPDEPAIAAGTADAAEFSRRIEDGERCIRRRFHAIWEDERYGLTGGEAGQVRFFEDDARQVRDGGRQWEEARLNRRGVGVEGHRLLRNEGADAGAAEGGDVTAAAKSLAEVAGEGADIGALSAEYFEAERWVVEVEDIDPIDADRAGRQIGRVALTGQVVRASAGEFGGGKRRRDLVN